MKCITFTAVAFAVLLGLFRCTHSQENLPSADDVLQQVSGIVGDIPELKNLNTSAIPSVEQARNLFKEKCTKNGGPDAFENAQRAQVEMTDCIRTLINITELEAEMEKYKPTGDLDIVFKNYCDKRTTLRACVYNFTNTMEHCLDEREKENKKIVMNITDSLLEFACFKQGDRIALFISTGGPECFQEKQQELQDCANKTFSSYLPKSDASGFIGLESLPTLNFETKECMDITNLQNCMVTELEKCKDSTPANIMDSILNYIKKVTPCEKLLKAQSAAATGTSVSFHVSNAFSTVAVLSIIAICKSFFILQ
ncbi:hypothetical protein DMN91_010702 [Ooceraea biroi]|uniref:27 kDa hemolymph glycoprotein n=1 Tax=Ooceraea biroi TaxID=2015173 RepID=A0A026WU00_OOCBI|nr:27 kDa hemolymph glycoprotein [Ooceraea biroi]EZA59545.1 27 kDa hemolymph glycoprotein [Ooceraea biroi]RLU16634.1 hypothetical protein DMN91_010702 [Ooceraea biroi]